MTAASEANNTAVTESAAGEVMTLAMTTEASVVANAVVATTLEMAVTIVAIAVRES